MARYLYMYMYVNKNYKILKKKYPYKIMLRLFFSM